MSLEINSFEFDEFCLKTKEKILLRGGKPVSLTPKALLLLFILVENHGQIVEKEDLMRAVWANSFVEDSNLTFTVSLLRKALSDNKKTSRYIETVPKRGYRFIGDVTKNFETDTLEIDDLKTTEKSSAPKSKKFPAVLAVCGLLCGAVFAASWFALKVKPATGLPIFNEPFALEKISGSGKVYSAAISPDGKMAVYSNETGGKQSLWLKRFEEDGGNVQIIPPSDDIYYKLDFSPNGNFIYFIRKSKSDQKTGSIYRVSIFGGVPSEIVTDAMGWLSISPDGEKISFTRCFFRDDEFCALSIADARDGKNERKIAVRPRPLRIGDNEFSPDGKRIVFAVGQSENAASEFGLTEIDLETGIEREFSPHKFFNIKYLAWLPDQSGLLVSASRIPNKHFLIWKVSGSDVAPLTKDSESYATLSIDRQANTISATQFKEDFYLRIFNLQNRNVAGKTLTSAFTAVFAPGGKIVFSSPMSGNDEIWSMNADGSEQKQLTKTEADEFLPVAAPDGNSIFFTSNRTGEMHVWRMNADGTNQTKITDHNGGMPMFVSPDGLFLYYLHGKDRTLWRVATAGGGEKLVIKKEKNRFALSPDGATVVYGEKQDAEKFFIFASVADGETKRKIKYPDAAMKMHEIAFLPDGKAFIYILSEGDYENYSLWFQTLEKPEPPRKIADLGSEEVTSFAVAPNGENFLVVQGSWKHDAVLFKGLK